MALGITDLKKGAIFQLDGVPYRVVEYSHKVMGRGGSTVNLKIKSLLDGKVLTKTLHGNDAVDSADVSSRPMQYLYSDADKIYLMDPVSFEQTDMPLDSDVLNFIKEGDELSVQFFDSRPINIELRKNLALKVKYTEDAVKGDTSSAITKDARLETGLIVKVPAFIKTGDTINVDTSTGSYRERVK